MEDIDKYLSTWIIIDIVKAQHDIRKPNSEMLDAEIAEIMRFIASGAPDTVWASEKPVFGRVGIGIMLSLSLYVFPEFYARYELWQRN